MVEEVGLKSAECDSVKVLERAQLQKAKNDWAEATNRGDYQSEGIGGVRIGVKENVPGE